ncbi:glycosyltransferase family 2 protein [Lachnobacterium bovis]|uniref:glycosyltransferase family 2 protein n=1 Tax=Lachnobacterium bovis TaxID=140626 RepID=UPI000AA0B137|nr:glycosyltransferase [Lachnobacterium bovis]
MLWNEYKELIKKKILKKEFNSLEMLEILNKKVLNQVEKKEIITDIRKICKAKNSTDEEIEKEKDINRQMRLLYKQLLVYLTGYLEDYCDFLLEIKELNDYKELVHMFLQARSMQIENPCIVSERSNNIFDEIDTKIYNLCREKKNVNTTHLRYELRENNMTVIIISKMEDEIDLDNLKEVCKQMYEICGKNIIVINTNDYVTENNTMPLLLPFFKEKDILEEKEELFFDNVKVQYISVQNLVEETLQMDMLIDYIREVKPYYVVNFGGINYFAKLVNAVVPTLTLTTNEQEKCTSFNTTITCKEDIKKGIKEYKYKADTYDYDFIENIKKHIVKVDKSKWVKTEPLVSVCTLVYNHELFLQEMLNGALMQKTSFPFEIIIHDDCSTDLSAKVIEEYQKVYPEIVYPVYQKRNINSLEVNIMEKIVYPKSRGKYIAWCEGDDYWTDENKLEIQVSYMEGNPDVAGTFHEALLKTKNGDFIEHGGREPEEKDYDTSYCISKSATRIDTATVVFNKEKVLPLPYFSKYAKTEDYLLFITISLRGKFHYFSKIMGVYRMSDNNWSSTVLNNPKKYKEFTMREIKWLLELNDYTDGKYYNEIAKVIAVRGADLVRVIEYEEVLDSIRK